MRVPCAKKEIDDRKYKEGKARISQGDPSRHWGASEGWQRLNPIPECLPWKAVTNTLQRPLTGGGAEGLQDLSLPDALC